MAERVGTSGTKINLSSNVAGANESTAIIEIQTLGIAMIYMS
jgi:hypothetical protein